MRSRAAAKLMLKKDATAVEKTEWLAKKKAMLASKEDRIVITQKDATEYVPGEREVSALSGLLNQKTELLKAIKTAKEAGKIDEAKAQLVKYLEVIKRIEEEQKKEQDQILASLEAA